MNRLKNGPLATGAAVELGIRNVVPLNTLPAGGDTYDR